MNIGRTILALLIALSVAMLPEVASANIAVKSTEMAEMADMAAMEDMDCCPHKAKPCDHCWSMATCQLTHFGFFATSASDIIFPSVATSLSPLSGANAFHPQEGNPPFRPPRV
jgi:hypothetical protein